MKRKHRKTKESSFDNNLYILRQLFAASRLRLPFESLFHVSKGITQTLIYTVLFGSIINSIVEGRGFTRILEYILLVAAFTAVNIWFQSWFQESFLPRDNARIQKYMLLNVYMHAASLDIRQYENPDFYDKYIRSLDEAGTRAGKLSNSIANAVGLLVTVLYLLGIIVSKEPLTLIFVLIPLVPGWLLGKKKNAVNYELYIKNTNPIRWTKYLNRIMYLKEYAKEIRVTGIYDVLTKRYDDTMDEIIANEKEYDRKTTILTLFMDFMNDKVIYVGILLYVSYLIVVKKKLQIGDYLIIQNAVASMTWRISALINSGLDLAQSGKFAGLLRGFMETKPISHAEGKKEIPDAEMNSIEFRDVSFSYDGKKEVLKNVNLKIKKGSRILIVGKNGAGKSTFVKLLMNLYEPTSGEILYNGKNIQDYDLSKYRHIYSSVFQDFYLYALSVGQNVAMDNYSDEKIPFIEKALKEVELMKKIERFDQGILSNVTKEVDDHGFVPSGGEKQKLAISRAIYQDSSVVILDEPSSALDPLSEAKINELMLKASEGKTIFMISHRLSSARLVDEVLLIDGGMIAERGSHEALMKLNGKYAEMYRMQEEQYELECEA